MLLLHMHSGGITRVSEALEVIDKAAALSGATAAERGRRSAGSEGGDSIQFRCGQGGAAGGGRGGPPCFW